MSFPLAAVLTLVFGLVSVFSFWRYVRSRKRLKQIVATGVQGEATITGHKTKKTNGLVTRFYVDFHYDVVKPDGTSESFTMGQSVTGPHYVQLKDGMNVPITYLPTDPKWTVQLAGDYTDYAGISHWAFNGIISLILMLVPLWFAGTTILHNIQAANADAMGFAATQAAVEPHLAQWQADRKQADHDIQASSLGLTGDEISDVYYGYCADGTFYVYVPAGEADFSSIGNLEIMISDAFTFTSKPDTNCAPKNWTFAGQPTDSDGGWYTSRVAIPLIVPP